MADNDKAAVPKPRARNNSVAVDHKERVNEAAPAVQAPRPDPVAAAIVGLMSRFRAREKLALASSWRNPMIQLSK